MGLIRRSLYRSFECIRRRLSLWGAGKLPFAHSLRNLAAKALAPRHVVVHGCRMRIHPVDHGLTPILVEGRYEPLQTRVIASLLRPGMQVADIGANIGYYTLLAAGAVGPSGHVWAFEPETSNYDLLLCNIRENKLENVTAEPKAVGAGAGTASLYLSSVNFGDHRLSPSAEPRRSLAVSVCSLDDYFRTRDVALDLVKMDIQGAEGGPWRAWRECCAGLLASTS